MNRLNLTLLLSTGLLTTAFFTSESRLDPKDANSEKALNDPMEKESIGRLDNSTTYEDTATELPAQSHSNTSYGTLKGDDPLSG